jgi:glycogen operon protein
VLAPVERDRPPIFIVLNAAPEAIKFTMPKMSEYKSWQQLLNTADVKQATAEFSSANEATAPPRSVMVFSGSV